MTATHLRPNQFRRGSTPVHRLSSITIYFSALQPLVLSLRSFGKELPLFSTLSSLFAKYGCCGAPPPGSNDPSQSFLSFIPYLSDIPYPSD
jgi:hypothetical protein